LTDVARVWQVVAAVVYLLCVFGAPFFAAALMAAQQA
jgi:hypothetical protein